MQWEFILALVVVIPVILLPVALVWYLNIGGILTTIQKMRRKKAAGEHLSRAAVDDQGGHAKPSGIRH